MLHAPVEKESLGAMKKTKLTRSLMAAVSVVALSAVMYGCTSSGGDSTPATEMPPAVDTDGDGVADADDAFPNDPTETVDSDGDGVGDNADLDDDNDGVADDRDDLPLNPVETTDTDMDGVGNNADADDDNDGVLDADDAFPLDAMETVDSDGDGVGDNADTDRDGDGVDNAMDAFPDDAMETADFDMDGTGDNADTDDDNDGVADADDAFPMNAMESADLDMDGTGDNADTDRDGDGAANADDAFPDDPMESADLDMDGTGDNADTDVDGDGVANADDAFPRDAMESADLDMDGTGDNADTDRDGDGAANADDAFPDDPMESADLDMDGTGDNADTDVDGDGVANADDAFPRDAMESADLDMDGTGDNADTDRDGDGAANADDAFPDDPMESADLDMDGTGDNADTDVDGDGVANADDAFPRDAMESADLDMDGTGDNADTDRDGDGAANADDAFPDDPMESADLDMDGVGDNADGDIDGDGVANADDAFPRGATESADLDMDGVGDNADTDIDGDGFANVADEFPRDPTEHRDSDGDGVGNNADIFPFDKDETADSDGDGVGDMADAFPKNPDETMDSDDDGIGDNADTTPGLDDSLLSLFKAANGGHVVDLDSTPVQDEKAEHVESVGAAMAQVAAAAEGNQAAGATNAATFAAGGGIGTVIASWPGDVAATSTTAAVPGMLSITGVNPGGAGDPIAFELGATRDADPTASPPIEARIQTAKRIPGLGAFEHGFDIWEDDGVAATGTDFHTDDGGRVIVFTDKTQDDPPVTTAIPAGTPRSVTGLATGTETGNIMAGELSNVMSTGATITGVTWTPPTEAPLTGTLNCPTAGGCSITLGADGAVAGISGYTFTGSRGTTEAVAAAPADAQATANNDYLIFGLWLNESNDGDTDTFGAFASGGANYTTTAGVEITDTVRYSGKAAGAHHMTGEGVSWFQGDAGLTANFGTASVAGTISGSIRNIRVNGGAAMSTPIYLGQADIAATFNGAAFMGAPTAPGASTHEFDGTWRGSFFGQSEAVEDDPLTAADETAAAGAFAPAAAAGTFGVTRSEGTGDDMVVESFVGAFGAHKD